jgi:hypothetical protein
MLLKTGYPDTTPATVILSAAKDASHSGNTSLPLGSFARLRITASGVGIVFIRVLREVRG